MPGTPKQNMTFVAELLVLLAEKQCYGEYVNWSRNLKFRVLCNDLFYWAVSDAQELNPEDLELLRHSLDEVDEMDLHAGFHLFCARVRKMRPQGAFYSYYDQKYWPLFDACGPEREIDCCNPYRPGEYQLRAE